MTSLSIFNSNRFIAKLLKIKALTRKETIYNRIYGFKRISDGTVVVVELEAKIIKLLYDYFLSGISVAEIKNRLDESNYRNRSGRLFTKKEIELFITRKIYTGYIDKCIFNVKSKVYPAIISVKSYRIVKKQLKNIKKQLICYSKTACNCA